MLRNNLVFLSMEKKEIALGTSCPRNDGEREYIAMTGEEYIAMPSREGTSQ